MVKLNVGKIVNLNALFLTFFICNKTLIIKKWGLEWGLELLWH